jgi:hypothetical protein
MKSDFDHGLYQIQKEEYEARIKELVQKIDKIAL